VSISDSDSSSDEEVKTLLKAVLPGTPSSVSKKILISAKTESTSDDSSSEEEKHVAKKAKIIVTPVYQNTPFKSVKIESSSDSDSSSEETRPVSNVFLKNSQINNSLVSDSSSAAETLSKKKSFHSNILPRLSNGVKRVANSFLDSSSSENENPKITKSNVQIVKEPVSSSDSEDSSDTDSKKQNHVVPNIVESVSKGKKDNSSDSGCSSDSEKTVETVENMSEKIEVNQKDSLKEEEHQNHLKRKISDFAAPITKVQKKEKTPNV